MDMNNRRRLLKSSRPRQWRIFSALTLSLALLISVPAGLTATQQETAQEPDKPKVTKAAIPAYPAITVLTRVCGKVPVEVEINAEGTVEVARALGGHPLLHKTSEDAARRWRFEPTAEGESVRTVQLIFEFKCLSQTDCKNAPVFISPYHVQISLAYELVAPADTISYIPADAEGKRCPVHHELLKKDKVEIIYGLTEFQPGYLKAEERSFPYAHTADYGGCLIEMEANPCDGTQVQISPKYAEVLYCETCRLAAQKWTKAHLWRRK